MDWKPDVGLMQEVGDQFTRAIDTYRIHRDLVSEHANLEESIRTGGYASRTLLELVQNAADALAGAEGDTRPEAGRVEIVLDAANQTLYCANTGRPFSRSGITAITMAHLSGKRGDEIGRFGLGFKSVLAISDAPQVLSRSVAFGFGSDEAREALTQVAPGVRRYPVLRTATPIDAAAEFGSDPILSDLAEWATTIVKLPAARNLQRLREEIEQFSSEFLLFVHAVREVHLRVVGPEPFETSHVSRDLGDGRLRIERPTGDNDEWLVLDHMHEPSREARQQVGEAVSRKQVKVTVALPAEQSRRRIGEFWSYFPLQDRTTASALFNAPWSVNDDRTTLLKNDYNREILQTLSEMFVAMLPRVVTPADPAAHLDYMPARGREILSFGDEALSAHIPGMAARRPLVPDAKAELRHPNQLIPLDFGIDFKADVHKAWCASPNTRDDVPHWKCYANAQRVTRLRTLFTSLHEDQFAGSGRDEKRALERVPKQGLQSWLLEWAQGDDVASSESALKVVATNSKVAGVREARVVPTNKGMRSLLDKDIVFLRQAPDLEMEGSAFVSPAFLERPGVEVILKSAGFRDLDPEAILNARIARLSTEPADDELTRLWEAALEVPQPTGLKLMKGQGDRILVPTKDGGWSQPNAVYDVDALSSAFAQHVLDHGRCLPALAHALGVLTGPVKDLSVDDEPGYRSYVDALTAQLNHSLGPGELPIRRVEVFPGSGPGPFSVLSMLDDAGASSEVRERWTTGLLQYADQQWTCEDLDTNRTFGVDGPAVWAAKKFGLLKTERGFRPPAEVVAPSLLRYQGLLPLLKGSNQVARTLDLPDELDEVPDEVFHRALAEGIFPRSLDDAVIVEFVLAASRKAYAGTRPPSIPARVHKAVESLPPAAVYLATDDEQASFLAARQRPFLRVAAENVEPLVTEVGCRRFEDSFTFSMLIDGQQASERIVDLYPGLRTARGAERVDKATLSRVALLAKRVTTEDGVEDQALQWHLDGVSLLVGQDPSEKECLVFINEAFGLHLDNAELGQVMQRGLNHRLELQRVEAQAAGDDASRLAVYFGEDDLREALPSGLWAALEAQRLVDARTSVAELFLTVWGSDSLMQLQENFRNLGYPDVPREWVGRPATISWLRRMGFGTQYAGRRKVGQEQEFVVPGAVRLNNLHSFQETISEQLREVITSRGSDGRCRKAMVELPTGAGKTRVASETVLRLFIEGKLKGPVLWIAQSQELCEQAVQTYSLVWRGLGDERPMTVGRLWDSNVIHEPDTEFSVVVATDAKLNSVLDNPEYEWLSRASVVIVDEAHRAGNSPMYTKILSWLGVAGAGWERPLVGLSATPFKGTSDSGTIALAKRFGNEIIRAFEGDAYQELADLGVLARVKHDVLDGIKVTLSAGEANDASQLRRVNPAVLDRVGRDQARMRILVDHIMSLDPSWPKLVFTPSVLSAQVLAASLRYRGVIAESVSGQTGRQQRRDVIRRFQEGDVRVLTNCDLLIQGFDAPGVKALYIARPTFSPSAYIQMAGRGLRGPANGGKEECLIVDMADDFGDMSKYLGYREYEPLWQEQQ
jgi:superfamily II DNA or RNA helicase